MFLLSRISRVEKLSLGLRSLYLHKIIRDIGTGTIGIFGVIFLYTISSSIEFVLVFFGLICLGYILFLPLWAKLIRFFSMHIFMAIGIVWVGGYFIIFYFLSKQNEPVFLLIVLLILFNLLNRLFYWVPYHVDFARFVNKHHKGRQLSFLSIVVSLIGIVLPIFSAFIISKFGYPVLYILAVFIVFISIMPIFFIPRTREKYSFGYFETFKKLFSKRHIKSNLAYIADGFQSHIGGIIWPIFIFLLFQGKYLDVGLVSAAIILVSCVLRYVMGEVSDKTKSKSRLIKISSLMYSLGWAFKAVATTAWHVFLVGVYHDFTQIFFRTPFDVLTYEIAADEGHYVDEFTIIREITLNIGRVLMVIFSLIVLHFLNIAWVFILGALVSLLVNLISKEEFMFGECGR